MICSKKIDSPKTKCACKIVDTGPILEMMATLLAPIFFVADDSRNVGITVATSASKIPYHHKSTLFCKGS
jgi:hypothetical protein